MKRPTKPSEIKVLIAEDSASQAEVLRRQLVQEGYQVIVTRNGADALQRTFAEEPDIVLLDIVMPQMDGYEVCRKIKSHHKLQFTPVVLVTILDDSDCKIKGIEAGADDFLNKPVDYAELTARVKSLLRVKSLYVESQERYEELAVLHREMRGKNRILEQLNEQKNQFLGMAAHDLRNPLNALLTYSNFLYDEVADKLTKEQVAFIIQMQESSQFMLKLVTDLLDISQIEAGKLDLNLASASLQNIVQRNVALNRVLADQKDISIACKTADLPVMLLDAQKLEQVLNNLITNAVKFSFPKTSIEVELMQGGDRALILVRDSGQGIPEDEQENLFKPFQRTSVQSTAGEKSTGLGLMIVRKIVEGHEGKIWVESTVGKGSTFYVSLPIHKPDTVVLSLAEPEKAETRSHQALQILVADDDAVNRHLLSRILEKSGHKVTAVESGRKVLEKLEAHTFDVLLLDVQMPDMGGIETTQHIRSGESDHNMVIIAVTAGTQQAEKDACLAAGMDACMGKPIDPKRLFQVIEELMELSNKEA
ncbi:MAG: response regulator [bacterium]|nr:response regulator [bacterium]